MPSSAASGERLRPFGEGKPALLGGGELRRGFREPRRRLGEAGRVAAIEAGIGKGGLELRLLALERCDACRQSVELTLLVEAELGGAPLGRARWRRLRRAPLRRRPWRRTLPQIVAVAADILANDTVALDGDDRGHQPIEEVAVVADQE